MGRISVLSTLLVVTLAIVPATTAQQTCQPCSTVTCPPTPTCAGNLVADDCGCCEVCAKQVGDACGQGIGKCDLNLECVPSSPGATTSVCVVASTTPADAGATTVAPLTPVATGTSPPPLPTSPPTDACAQISADWKASYDKWSNLVNNWEQEFTAWKEKNKQTP